MISKFYIFSFLRDVVDEVRLINWPVRSEIVSLALAVFVMIVLFALFFLIVDSVLAAVMYRILGV